MFLRLVFLVFGATCCTALVIDANAKQSAWEESGDYEDDIGLTEEDVTELGSAWELSGKFEGDIMLTEEERNSGLINTARRWPNKLVPFFIDPVFLASERTSIMAGINAFGRNTTIRFERHFFPPDGDFIHITGTRTGCWSYIGRTGGRQRMNLQPHVCIHNGIIAHELLHALGFLHMHSATDRDNYVIIHWENIQSGMEPNFQSFPETVISSFGVPYDFGSVMHYGPFAFSRNGMRTIVPRVPNATIGQRDGLSARDILRLERMYENASYATRLQFITSIIITLYVLTHLL